MNLKKDTIINLLWVFIPLFILFIFSIPKYLKKGEEAKHKSADLNYKITPQSIIHQISIRGASAVVKELNEIDSGNPYEIIMSNIETGQPEWIDVAKKLSPGTDAGWSEILDEALFMALEKSPELVLEASTTDCRPNSFCIETICGPVILIDYPPDDKAIQLIQNRKRSVEKISNDELREKRDRCISLLEKDIKIIRQMQKECK